MPIFLARRELYDRVWSEPLQKLCTDFSVSDVGLAKLCRRYNIPVPPRGYWAKKQAGKGAAAGVASGGPQGMRRQGPAA